MQAFLQRIVNGGGRVEREYGLGRKRTDLLVLWPVSKDEKAGIVTEWQKTVIELKIAYGTIEQTVAKGLEQTWEYMDRCGAKEGHLVIFDRAPKKTWQAKIFRREGSYLGTPITVWGM